MKRHIHILFLALLMAACTPAVETRHGTSHDSRRLETRHGASLPNNMVHQQLQTIDSLMWRRPDSALMVMQGFAGSPEANSLDVFEGHYCQLLISELLYKNYYAQSNRAELLQAVGYFDSIVVADETDGRKVDARSASIRERDAFLDARAHCFNGVGFYEKGNVVQACAEYLKAVEVMEEHFEKKTLTGEKAVFMDIVYSRLLELFSAQFMMDPAITCGEQALVYCQKDSTLFQDIPIVYYHIGKQYDKKGNKDIARSYYGMSIERIPDLRNVVYRDIVSTKALCDYQAGLGLEQSLNDIRQLFALSKNKNELLTRYMTIGAIYFEEGLYDSVLRYLEPVFENKDDQISQIQAADYLRLIYDSLGCKEKSDECARFLADNKKTEGENNALTSQLENMFKIYQNQKQEKEAEKEREKSIRKTIGIIVPIALAIVLAIIVMAKLRSRKLLRLEMEKLRQAHQAQQNALSGRLKRSNQELRELKEQMKQQDNSVAKAETAASFAEEPICRLIMERVQEGRFLSQMDCKLYKDYALVKQQLLDLRLAADRHFNQFTVRLMQAYPKLTNSDLDYCCLYLLGLTDADVSALMQKAYPTISQRSRKIKAIMGNGSAIPITLRDFANCNL